MKFGHSIECNLRNIFLEKWYTKCAGETSPRPFSEQLKLGIFLDQLFKVYTVCFHCMASWELLKYTETKLLTMFLPHIKLFKKMRRALELSPCLIFCIILKEKYLSCYTRLIDQI